MGTTSECLRHHTINCETCAMDYQERQATYRRQEQLADRHESAQRMALPRTMRNATKHRHVWRKNVGYHHGRDYGGGGWEAAYICRCGESWKFDKDLNPTDRAEHAAAQDREHDAMNPKHCYICNAYWSKFGPDKHKPGCRLVAEQAAEATP